MKKEVKVVEYVENGTKLTMVPVGNTFVTLYKEDYDRLIELGAYKRWQLIRDKYVRCGTRNGMGHVMIARALVDCPPGFCVVYFDGNPLNLRRENLGIRKGGKGKHDARGLMCRERLERKRRTHKGVIPAVELGVFGNV